MALKLRSRKCSQPSSSNENEAESNNIAFTNSTSNHKKTSACHTLEKTVQRQSLAKYSQPLVAEITRWGFFGTCTFFIEFSIYFKWSREKIVFSISQTT